MCITPAPRVAVVNEAFARRYFGGRPPIGERFSVDGDDSGQDIEIVGMVGNFKQHDLRTEAFPMVYYPVAQQMQALFTLLTRSRQSPETLVPEVSRVIAEVASDLPLLVARPLSDVIERTLQQEKMIAKLTTLFGMLALVLASLGLYGVVAYGVSRRTREIGVRIALGALRSQVTWMALKSALALVLIGVAIGLTMALASGRLISGLLFGLDPAAASFEAAVEAGTLTEEGVATIEATDTAKIAYVASNSAADEVERGLLAGMALGLGIGYFVLVALFEKMGEAELVPPMIGAWTPVVLGSLFAINRMSVLRT